MISHSIHLNYQHRVVFTEGVFDPQNETLREILCVDGEHRRQRRRVLLVIDGGLLDGQPELIGTSAAWFARRAEVLDLRGQPLVIPGGEACKNDFSLVGALWSEIHEAGLDRHSYVVVAGGGAVLDLVGFAAATAHRGIRLVRLPSTSLSQGDGGVGVKNGVNFFGKKNWVGTFAVPHAVVNDLRFLQYLPDSERRAGFIEAIKVSLIRDAVFFEKIEQSAPLLCEFDSAAVRFVIERSAQLHLKHIANGGDPFELGSARPLDFGHWVAHKLEQVTEFAVGHGEAVAIGMAVDLIYARQKEMLDAESLDRILRLIAFLGFSLWHDALLHRDDSGQLLILRGLEEFREHLGGDLCVTLVTEIGSAVEVGEIDAATVESALHELSVRTAPLAATPC